MKNNNELEYTLIRSRRKSISLSINSEGSITVKAPNRMPEFLIQQFVSSKAIWIEKQLSRFRATKDLYPIPDLNESDIAIIKEEFKKDILIHIDELSKQMNVRPNAIRLTSARSRWGSCSSKRNININWRLALLPNNLSRYVIVHELAHLRHMNHSPRFWRFVQAHDTEYKTHRKDLKNYSHFLTSL